MSRTNFQICRTDQNVSSISFIQHLQHCNETNRFAAMLSLGSNNVIQATMRHSPVTGLMLETLPVKYVAACLLQSAASTHMSILVMPDVKLVVQIDMLIRMHSDADYADLNLV